MWNCDLSPSIARNETEQAAPKCRGSLDAAPGIAHLPHAASQPPQRATEVPWIGISNPFPGKEIR